MNIPPKKTITYKTNLKKEEILKKLHESLDYEGSTDIDTFTISRIINYRNSFLPRIKGRISTDYNTTTIEVTMQLHKFVFVFMAVWLIGVLSFFVISLINVPFNKLVFFDTIPLVMLIFGILLMYIPFTIESRKSEKDLEEMFEAEITSKSEYGI